ncbi:MAG: tetratricopeptide repeat protein, partial [Planctomycetota bacterium]|nr:tetratricopeptide repeat protein [Planctomycetota bacterium]
MASRLFNHTETQYILELVLRSHLERRQWDKAQEVLKQLGSRGRVGDLELLGHGEIALQQNNLELAFRSIQAIRDLFLRTKMWKRLVHKTAVQEDYGLLLSFHRASTLQKDSEYHLIHGYALYQDGLHLRAYDAFQQAFTSSQGGKAWIQEQALFLRSTIELRSRDFEQAGNHLQELLSEFEESSQRSEYYFWLGVLQLEQRQSLKGIHLSMRQVEPDGPRGDGRWYVLGFSSHETNDWGKAIAFLKQLVEKHSQSLFREEGFYRLADAYYQQGQHLEADQVFSEYREEFQQLSNAVRVIERQAQNTIKLGKLEEAHALLLKEVPIHPDFRLVALHLDILNEIQDDPGVLELANRVRNYDFSSDQRGLVSYHQANSLFRMKRFEESLGFYLEAQQDPPPDRLRFIKYRIIQGHHTLNNYSQFTALSENFVKENQNDGKGNRVLTWLSDYYEQEGKP